MFRTSLALLALAVLISGTAVLAAEGETEALGRREQMTVRMLTERLDLSPDQKAELEKILLQNKKETESKIRSILTDEQKTAYEKMQEDGGRRGGRGFGRAFPGGREGRGRPGGPMGGFGSPGDIQGGMTRILEEMKTRLNLSDRQHERIQEILGDIMGEASEKFMEKLPEYMENGRPNIRKMMSEMRKEFEPFLDKAHDKIVKVLNDDQIPGFEKMFEELKAKISEATGGGREGRRPDSGASWVERRLDRIMDDLAGSPEEKMIIREKVENILKIQNRWMEQLREARRNLDELLRADGALSGDIQGKLQALRDVEKQYEKELAAAREELIPILSFEQEAKLVIHRILE